jgi:hypothetical protein
MSSKVRVSIYVPEEIHTFVVESCERIITARGKQVKFTKTLSEAYVEFIKKGIASCTEDDDGKDQ